MNTIVDQITSEEVHVVLGGADPIGGVIGGIPVFADPGALGTFTLGVVGAVAGGPINIGVGIASGNLGANVSLSEQDAMLHVGSSSLVVGWGPTNFGVGIVPRE